MLATDPFGQRRHLRGLEVVDGNRNADAAQVCNEFRRLLDRLRPVIVRPGRCIRPSGAAARANHGRARLTERGGNATARAARRARHDGNAPPKRTFV